MELDSSGARIAKLGATEKSGADQRAGEVGQAADRCRLAVVADREATVVEEPPDSPLHHPTMSTELLVGIDPASSSGTKSTACMAVNCRKGTKF